MISLSHTFKAIASMPHMFLGGAPGERAGEALLASRRLGVEGTERLTVRSEAFAPDQPIPSVHAADGQNLAPPLQWTQPPPGTAALVLLCEDPDAPTPQPFVHWLLYNLSPRINGLPAALEGEAPVVLNGGAAGKNSMLRTGWTGCAPPKGDLAHRYHFQLFALDRVLELGASAGRSAVLKAMRGHVIGFGEVVGTYRRT